MFLLFAEYVIRSNMKTNCAGLLFCYTRQESHRPQIVTVGYLMYIRNSSLRPIDGFCGKLIHVATMYLIKYLSSELTNRLIYLQVYFHVCSHVYGESVTTQMKEK
jgi:hypothetical protein